MPRTNIEETYAFNKLFDIEGVVSATIGETPQGRQCVVVTFEKEFSDNVDKLPKKIDGYPVRAEFRVRNKN